MRSSPNPPLFPASWYYLCQSSDLLAGSAKPFSRTVAGTELIAYRTRDGSAVVMAARCSHFGSNLAHGRLEDDCIRCPFHGWRYSKTGECISAGAAQEIPRSAGQQRYPAEEHFGQLFFFLGQAALFSFPAFISADPAALTGRRPFRLQPQCAWFMVAANGFDLQHFRGSHDRTVNGEVLISRPAPQAIRAVIPLAVVPKTLFDRLTAWLAGGTLTFTVTAWGGTLLLVEAVFPRTTTFGLVSLNPLSAEMTEHINTVLVRRSRTIFGRLLFDRINSALRRWAIKRFVSADLLRMAGSRFSYDRCSNADAELRQYFLWAESLPAGKDDRIAAPELSKAV